MKRNLIVLLIIVLLAGFAIYQNNAAKGKEAIVATDVAPKKGYLAPTFTLDSLNDRSYQVGGARDKPLLLNYWASWCGPCTYEAPHIQALFEKYKDRIDIYGVNTTKNDFFPDVKEMVKKFNLTFPILLDKEGTVTNLYNVQVLPTSYFIDKQGAIVDVTFLLEPEELERKIKNLIER